MSEARTLARTYLTPPAGTFWLWSHDAKAVTWGDGTTIAFREEVEAVLERLAPAGLPPFGSIVLLLAACRDSWRETAARTGMYEFVALLERQRQGGLPISRVLESLNRVASLPQEYRQGIEAKCLLAETVFERCSGDTDYPVEAQSILGAFRGGLGGDDLRPEPELTPLFGIFDQDLAPLAVGLDGIDEETLECRRRTGLPRPPEPPELELRPAGAFRDAIERLLEDPELSGLARVARDLMAAIHLPAPLGEPEELPLGGYSDLANRGPLDRLLPSELSHDDLTLAVRIALGEALYLRRETPPRAPLSRRTILLDSGIRLWGIPRVFATALALALAAKAERATGVRIFRAQGSDLAPVDLSRREEIVEHLEALEPEAHPGAALAAFLAEARSSDAASEPVLVTHAAAIDDPEFRTEIGGRLYLATVDGDGTYRLFDASPRGRVLLGEARLSLAEILPRQPAARVEVEEAPGPLPLYFGLRSKPLLVPHGVDPRCACHSPRYGVVSVATKQGRLTHWTGPRRGPRELADQVPPGSVHWISIDEASGTAHVLVGRGARHWLPLFRVDLATGSCMRIDLPASGYPPLGVFRDRSAVFLVHKRGIDLFDLESGERIDAFLSLSGQRWLHGRFFAGPGGASVLGFDGVVARFEPIRGASPGAFLFDRPGRDGPWALVPEGVVRSLADGTIIRFDGGLALPPPVRVLGVSRDGNRIAVPAPDGVPFRYLLLDLPARRIRSVPDDYPRALEPELLETTGPAPVSRKLEAVALDREGRLCLRLTKGRRARVVLDFPGPLSLEFTSGDIPLRHDWIPLENARALRIARWSDGSRAIVDRRGLLHLVPADRRVPELALLLVAGHYVAGWSSCGHVHGPEYLVGDAKTVDARAFHAELQAFLSRLPR